MKKSKSNLKVKKKPKKPKVTLAGKVADLEKAVGSIQRQTKAILKLLTEAQSREFWKAVQKMDEESRSRPVVLGGRYGNGP